MLAHARTIEPRHFKRPPRMCLGTQPGVVAQICNLPYRRFVIGGASENSSALALAGVPQNAILRYGRLQIITNLRYG
jgi:hypothetical protein